MIIFGRYSFAVKSYRAGELPFRGDFQAEDLIEFRVQVGHLFWIPFFPLWSGWVLNRKGKQYKMSEEATRQLDQFQKVSIPFYAFSGLFLIPLLLIGYQVWETQKQQQVAQWQDEARARVRNEVASMIDTPSVQHYYMIFPGKCDSNYQESIFKVSDFSTDSISLLVPNPADTLPWSGKLLAVRAFFRDSTRTFTNHTIARSTLRSAAMSLAADPDAFPGIPIEPISGNACLKIGRIEHIPEGWF